MSETPAPEHPERRRAPRVNIHPALGVVCSIPVSASVQVLDISQSGVLIAVAHALDVGRSAQLRTRIGAEPLSAQIEIRRTATGLGTGAGPVRLGARFVSLDDETSRRIERLLKVEN